MAIGIFFFFYTTFEIKIIHLKKNQKNFFFKKYTIIIHRCLSTVKAVHAGTHNNGLGESFTLTCSLRGVPIDESNRLRNGVYLLIKY